MAGPVDHSKISPAKIFGLGTIQLKYVWSAGFKTFQQKV